MTAAGESTMAPTPATPAAPAEAEGRMATEAAERPCKHAGLQLICS